MAFGQTTILDSYDRANENPLSFSGKWTGPLDNDNGMGKIVSNILVSQSTGGGWFSSAFWNGRTLSGPVEAYADVLTTGATNEHMRLHLFLGFVGGTYVSAATAINGYAVDFTFPNTWIIYRITSSSKTTLASGTTTNFAAGDGIGGRVANGVVSIYRRSSGVWSSLGSANDSTYTSGFLGFEFNAGNITVDNFGGGIAFEPSLTESAVFSESFSRVGTIARTPSEAPTISDTSIRNFKAIRLNTESVALSDSPIDSQVYIRNDSVDPVFIADIAGYGASGSRSLIESMTLSETLTKRLNPVFRSVSESLTRSESVTRLFSGTRIPFDPLNISDICVRTVKIFITDSLTRKVTYRRLFTESFSIGDTLDKATNLNRSLAESINAVDVLSRNKSGNYSVNDSASISESVTRLPIFLRSRNESIGVNDVLARVIVARRTFSDAIQVSNFDDIGLQLKRGLIDSIILNEDFDRQWRRIQSVVDNITLSDLSDTNRGYQVDNIDSLSTNDSASRVYRSIIGLLDSLATSDVIIHHPSYSIHIVDSFSMGDSSPSLIKEFNRQPVENLLFSDIATTNGIYLRSIEDDLKLVEENLDTIRTPPFVPTIIILASISNPHVLDLKIDETTFETLIVDHGKLRKSISHNEPTLSITSVE